MFLLRVYLCTIKVCIKIRNKYQERLNKDLIVNQKLKNAIDFFDITINCSSRFSRSKAASMPNTYKFNKQKNFLSRRF